tara:strand:- start:1042 stop:2448 length:1407 start_codon:yes stop_codon:yes gene_type:complete
VVQLRRKHDRLHDSNAGKRRELNKLADKLKDLHNGSYSAEESPQVRLKEMEDLLSKCAGRYEEEHKLKMTYEQVINRLKHERLGFPENVKALDQVLVTKEHDYESLLLMSHDANHSKEVARQELAKFESLVSEERKMREKELQERRQVLQKKQSLATELAVSEGDRRKELEEPLNRAGEEATKQQTAEIERLIEQEGEKIQAYEAAFGQIKEATGVADVNEVIQKFLSQEETHQHLLQMTRDSQGQIDAHREALEHERNQVSKLQYALVQSEDAQDKRRPTRDADHPERDMTAQARQSLERGRARWKRIWRTQVNCKAAVQHILEQLEPLRLDEELGAPLTDETMVPLLQQAEKKLMRIAAAFLEEEQRHATMLKSSADYAALKQQQPPPQSPGLGMGTRARPEDDDEDDEFEEDLEEDVPDREALKRQALSMVDKGSKKPKKKRKPKNDDGGSPAKGATSTSMGGLA